MRSWTTRARAVDARLSIEVIESLTRSLGTPACTRTILDALNRFATVDHCALFVRLRDNDLRMLATESRVSRSNAARAAMHYMSEMHHTTQATTRRLRFGKLATNRFISGTARAKR